MVGVLGPNCGGRIKAHARRGNTGSRTGQHLADGGLVRDVHQERTQVLLQRLALPRRPRCQFIANPLGYVPNRHRHHACTIAASQSYCRHRSTGAGVTVTKAIDYGAGPEIS